MSFQSVHDTVARRNCIEMPIIQEDLETLIISEELLADKGDAVVKAWYVVKRSLSAVI